MPDTPVKTRGLDSIQCCSSWEDDDARNSSSSEESRDYISSDDDDDRSVVSSSSKGSEDRSERESHVGDSDEDEGSGNEEKDEEEVENSDDEDKEKNSDDDEKDEEENSDHEDKDEDENIGDEDREENNSDEDKESDEGNSDGQSEEGEEGDGDSRESKASSVESDVFSDNDDQRSLESLPSKAKRDNKENNIRSTGAEPTPQREQDHKSPGNSLALSTRNSELQQPVPFDKGVQEDLAREKSKAKAALTRCQYLEGELAASKKRVVRMETRHSQEIKDLKLEKEEERKKERKKFSKEKSRLEDRVKELEKETKALKFRVSCTKDTEQRKREKVEKKLEDAEERILKLEEKCSKLKKDYDKKVDSVINHTVEMQMKLEDEKAALADRVEELEKENGLLDNKFSELQRKLKKAKGAFSAVFNDVEDDIVSVSSDDGSEQRGMVSAPRSTRKRPMRGSRPSNVSAKRPRRSSAAKAVKKEEIHDVDVHEEDQSRQSREPLVATEPIRGTIGQLSALTSSGNAILEQIGSLIKEGKIKKIVIIAGAGMSTSAGIPDFRTPGTGLYDNLQKFELPKPEALFDISFFKKNPVPFATLAKDLLPGKHHPTKSHFFVKLLEEKDLLIRHYTQNIDDLEVAAGVSQELLVQAHGTFSSGRCIKCKRVHVPKDFRKSLLKGEVPRCKNCKGYVKPDIVFFGEDLPKRFYGLRRNDFADVDLLLVMGTSLAVRPVSMLIHKVPAKCHRLLINREIVGGDFFLPLSGSDNGVGEGLRGIFMGDCDDGCEKLASACGWKDVFEGLQSDGLASLANREDDDADESSDSD